MRQGAPSFQRKHEARTAPQVGRIPTGERRSKATKTPREKPKHPETPPLFRAKIRCRNNLTTLIRDRNGLPYRRVSLATSFPSGCAQPEKNRAPSTICRALYSPGPSRTVGGTARVLLSTPGSTGHRSALERTGPSLFVQTNGKRRTAIFCRGSEAKGAAK